MDAWSDLDVLLVIEDRALKRYYPSIEWLRPMGTVWAYQHPPDGVTTLVRFADFHRLDLVFRRRSELPKIAAWGAPLLWAGYRVTFSRSQELNAALSQQFVRPAPPAYDATSFCQMVNAFWFTASVGVYKVVRGDLLIALHLALELEQQCLVLGMILRDRDAGMTHHRDGGGAAYLERLRGVLHEHTPAGILLMIEACAILFDALAAEYVASYAEHRAPLLQNIAEARLMLFV